MEASVTTLTLVNMWDEHWPKDVPIFLDFHVCDIPETMKLAIDNAPANVVAISFGIDRMPTRWQKKVKVWCEKRNIEAIFWRYPKDGN